MALGIDDHRAGRLAYTTSNGGKLLTSLNRFYPRGAFRSLERGRQYLWVPTTMGSFAAQGGGVYYTSLATWPGYAGPGLGFYASNSETGEVYPMDSAARTSGEAGKCWVFRHSFGHILLSIRLPVGVTPEQLEWHSRIYPDGLDRSVLYVDPVAGDDDLNSGTIRNEPLRSCAAAAALSPDVIVLAPGVYIEGEHAGEYTIPASDILFVCDSGLASFVSVPPSMMPAWIESAEHPDVLESVIGGSPVVTLVADLDNRDEYGDPNCLFRTGSLSELLLADSGCFFDSNTRRLYVKRGMPGIPGERQLIPCRVSIMGMSAPGSRVMFKGIEFIGGSAGACRGRGGDVDSVLVVEDCGFFGNYNADGFQIKDIGLSIAVNCRGSQCANDIANYHSLNGLAPHFIEINCRWSGGLADGTGNGTTAHEDVVGFRLNVDIADCRGPGLADVDEARSFNVNITSKGHGPHGNASGVRTRNAAAVYIDGLYTSRNAGGGIVAAGDSHIFVRRVISDDGIGASDNAQVSVF